MSLIPKQDISHAFPLVQLTWSFMKQKNKTECLRLTYSAEQSLKYEIIRARKRSHKLLVETENNPNLRNRQIF